MATRIVPLFPLNTVLFPGMWLSLHIFEDRYKEMVGWCQEHKEPFGVALIREGQEVGGTADPHAVGTLARIEMIQTLEGGRFYLQTQGLQRFRVQRLIHERAYLQGEIELIEEKRVSRRAARTKQVMADATRMYLHYLELIRRMGGQVGQVIESALDPEFLSWLIASTMIAAPNIRQELLEIIPADARLEREMMILREIIENLEARIARGSSTRSLPFSLN
ncbi:MAG: hypothetical protein FJX76_21135 [Armatimonadetes bacterium]|nr:hypothetical protein [Armatimonadota bacterium]